MKTGSSCPTRAVVCFDPSGNVIPSLSSEIRHCADADHRGDADAK
jgi:hypothetical protein